MAAGDFAKYSGSGQAVPTTSYATIDVGAEDVDAGGICSEVSGVFTPSEAGFYLVIAEGKLNVDHNNRVNPIWKIQKNSANVGGASNSGYARNNTNRYAYLKAQAILEFNGTTDTFRVQHARDTGAGTLIGNYVYTRVKIIHLGASLPYAHYGTPTSGAYGGTSATAIGGWDAITETDTSVIEVQAGGTDIQLKEANRPYLIVYGLENSDTGSVRTTRVSDITLGGTRIPHSAAYTYQRDSANQYGVPSGMALVHPTTANQNINVRCWGYDNQLATLWGTWENGAWTLSSLAGEAGVMVIALPPTTDVAIYDDLTGGTTISGATTADISVFKTTIVQDSPFSRISDTAIDVTEATDIFSHAASMVERTASSGTRSTQAVRWELEGVDQADTENGDYLRGEQGSQDCKNMVLTSSFVGAVGVNGTLNFEKFDPGTDDGNSDQTSFGGAFFIDLSTLEGAPAVNEITTITMVNATSDVDLFDIAEGQDIDFSLVDGINIGIYAKTVGTIGSVNLNMTGPISASATESVAPYSLYGDASGDFAGVTTFAVGSYNITITAYDGAGGAGNVIDTFVRNFTITSASLTGQIKIWNGSSFEAKPVKFWNGSAWVTKPLKRWNGSAWITTTY